MQLKLPPKPFLVFEGIDYSFFHIHRPLTLLASLPICICYSLPLSSPISLFLSFTLSLPLHLSISLPLHVHFPISVSHCYYPVHVHDCSGRRVGFTTAIGITCFKSTSLVSVTDTNGGLRGIMRGEFKNPGLATYRSCRFLATSAWFR